MLAPLVTALGSLTSLALAVPASLWALEIVSARRKKPDLDPDTASNPGGATGASELERGARRPRSVVVMPAHDEAANIVNSIRSVLGELGEDDELLVVADNCTDDTAAIARTAGARVIERHDTSRRGKGYALDFGIRHLAERGPDEKPPEVVFVVDADCHVGRGSLRQLAMLAAGERRPVQALYLMRLPEGASVKLKIAAFAWIVKNQLRPSGALRLGIPCQLMGTGMAFPWELARSLEWASGHLVEDMELGVDLALRSAAPLFCEDALVESTFPTNTSGVASQRKRWEHGHLTMIRSQVPRLLGRGVRTGDLSLIGFGLDLAIPPLAFLVLLVGANGVVAALLALTGVSLVPFAIAAFSAAALALGLVVAWRRAGHEVVSLRELLRVPVYVFGKVPLYLGFARRKQQEWVRTERDPSATDHEST